MVCTDLEMWYSHIQLWLLQHSNFVSLLCLIILSISLTKSLKNYRKYVTLYGSSYSIHLPTRDLVSISIRWYTYWEYTTRSSHSYHCVRSRYVSMILSYSTYMLIYTLTIVCAPACSSPRATLRYRDLAAVKNITLTQRKPKWSTA